MSYNSSTPSLLLEKRKRKNRSNISGFKIYKMQCYAMLTSGVSYLGNKITEHPLSTYTLLGSLFYVARPAELVAT